MTPFFIGPGRRGRPPVRSFAWPRVCLPPAPAIAPGRTGPRRYRLEFRGLGIIRSAACVSLSRPERPVGGKSGFFFCRSVRALSISSIFSASTLSAAFVSPRLRAPGPRSFRLRQGGYRVADIFFDDGFSPLCRWADVPGTEALCPVLASARSKYPSIRLIRSVLGARFSAFRRFCRTQSRSMIQNADNAKIAEIKPIFSQAVRRLGPVPNHWTNETGHGVPRPWESIAKLIKNSISRPVMLK